MNHLFDKLLKFKVRRKKQDLPEHCGLFIPFLIVPIIFQSYEKFEFNIRNNIKP